MQHIVKNIIKIIFPEPHKVVFHRNIIEENIFNKNTLPKNTIKRVQDFI